jgi:hypothetical protein
MDQWNEVLHCPKCRNEGQASFTQAHDMMIPTVQSVPDAFDAVLTENGPIFYCAACRILVDP